MALIKINDTALIESSVTIGEKINQLNDMKSRLNSIAGAISDSWQGSSSAAYANVLCAQGHLCHSGNGEAQRTGAKQFKNEGG
jgi:hypothetical protein